MMKLSTLIKDIEIITFNGNLDLDINSICSDSRIVQSGAIFIAIKGKSFDGNNYINEAIKRGAVLIISEKYVNTGINISYLQVKCSRTALAMISKSFYQNFSDSLNIIGITGTNGKTSTTFMIKSILDLKKTNTGLISTIHSSYNGRILPSKHTTPEANELHKLFYEMYKHGCKNIVLEVSSHALALKRVLGIKFNIAVFTNLSRDHLDYHKTFENYFLEKLKLFKQLDNNGVGVVNIDNEWGRKLANDFPGKLISIGSCKEALVRFSNIKYKHDKILFKVNTPWGKLKINLPLIGEFQVYNATAAIAVAAISGIELSNIKKGLECLANIPGRLELVFRSKNNKVFVDYAHTHEALNYALKSLKRICMGNLWIVFGCGGNRDKEKRVEMGAVASNFADNIIITSDNPRDEDPKIIANDILLGCNEYNKVEIIINRKDAIIKALKLMKNKDIVLIAGKGHENYQEISGSKIPFDDREVVKDFFND